MATYPNALKTYTNKVDGVDTVLAADINSVQDEVQAIQTELGVNPSDSALPSAGTYNPNGVSTTLSARVANLEAGLTGNATDGARVGYTLLSSGNYTSAPGAISVAGVSYTKLVVVVNVTTVGSATSILLAMNGITTNSYKHGYFNFTTAVPSTGGGSLTAGAFPISNGVAPAAGDSVTAEIYNVNGAGSKTARWVNGTGFGSGATVSGAFTGAITSVTLSSTTYPTSATYAIYGVK